jgi:hypothetical protein
MEALIAQLDEELCRPNLRLDKIEEILMKMRRISDRRKTLELRLSQIHTIACNAPLSNEMSEIARISDTPQVDAQEGTGG